MISVSLCQTESSVIVYIKGPHYIMWKLALFNNGLIIRRLDESVYSLLNFMDKEP